MDIKRIIKEEIEDLSWLQDVSNTPLTYVDKAEIIERFIDENEEELAKANHFISTFWKEYSNVAGNFSVNDLRDTVTVMFAQQFNSK